MVIFRSDLNRRKQKTSYFRIDSNLGVVGNYRDFILITGRRVVFGLMEDNCSRSA